MSEFTEQQRAVTDARRHRDEAEDSLYLNRNRLTAKRVAVEEAMRRGRTAEHEIARLNTEISRLSAVVAGNVANFARAKRTLQDAIIVFPGLDNPQKLIEELNDRLPILLLPVRVETRFMTVDNGKELWVRIFPDDVAVHSHEKVLTPDEVEVGHAYWREVWGARQESDDVEREAKEKGAWRAFAGEYGSTRAAWIAAETRPETLDVAAVSDLIFPPFDPDALKQESWSRAPRSKVMPDRFVVILYAGDERVAKVGAPIPDPLITGPDPQSADGELLQSEGDLLPGVDLEWIYDFGKAVNAGMGVKIPLQEPHASGGFDRLLVVGLRLSSDEQESKTLLEDLLENHHYSPDGMGIIPQGTPTNNTYPQGSGFSSVDPEGNRGFAVETGEPMFEPTDVRQARSDAQRLVEALGIDHQLLQYVEHANRFDVREAQLMNKALWPATLGYFLEELLGLDAAVVRQIRSFCADYVTGRGPLPALRIGTQPYGILPTSALDRWKVSRVDGGQDFQFLQRLQGVLVRLDEQWTELLDRVSHINGGGDPFADLLSTLGLHATSVQFHRRHAVGREYIWNHQQFTSGNRIAQIIQNYLAAEGQRLLRELGLDFEEPPKIFDLAFFQNQDEITDPLVEDVDLAENERWSETAGLKLGYKIPDVEEVQNYIRWLIESKVDDIKRQVFLNEAGERQPIPKALLYRMLRRALLLAYHDATLQIYENNGVVQALARREVELPNVRAERTVTRWEFMEAKVGEVTPQVSDADLSVVEFLRTPAGLGLSESSQLRDLRACLTDLAGLPTARLERLFAEHLDLCSYRLDAWQMGLITRRLEVLRSPEPDSEFVSRTTGIYLGAFGWLEDVRPAAAPVPVRLDEVPESLREPEKGPIVEQPENGGFIPAFSINHAVTAAVLRNAYLTHADKDHPERMSVNLSSERVRTALGFLEGIRNGQELGALLGYQFERGLHDRHGDPSLNQFLPAFRDRYPLVADKITTDDDGEQVETKEARNVFDGYALVEAAFLRDNPIAYPYDVEGLPPDDDNDPQVRAIKAQVERMAASFDAVADLALAEGIYQVVQGNYERGGAMMKALTEGANPPDPEIVRTPRTGTAVTHRVMVNLESAGDAAAWPGDVTPRSTMEPGVNQWLEQIIDAPGHIRFIVQSTQPEARDATVTLADLDIQPIDLVYMLGDELTDERDVASQDDTTELERRIVYEYRKKKQGEGVPDVGDVTISFMERDPSWTTQDKTLFELAPLLRRLRELVTGCRPLAADDLRLPSGVSNEEDPNPKGYDPAAVEARVNAAAMSLQNVIVRLANAILVAEPLTAGASEFLELADALRALAGFGIPDAFPRQAGSLLTRAKSASEAATAQRDALNRGLTDLNNALMVAEGPTATDGDFATLGDAIAKLEDTAGVKVPGVFPDGSDGFDAAERAVALQRARDTLDLIQPRRDSLTNAIETLTTAITPVEEGSFTNVALTNLQQALTDLGALRRFDPLRVVLLDQANNVREVADAKRQRADDLIAFHHLAPERIATLTIEDKVEIYRDAARAILGPAFNLLPRFSLKNSDEIAAALAFRDADPAASLTRFSDNPLVVEEWLQGVARVREKMGSLEEVCTFNDAFNDSQLVLRPLQLPFREMDHWLAVEYPPLDPANPDDPNAFRPEGDYLSIVQQIPAGGFDIAGVQTGFLIDEWTEIIPNKVETSGIAVHFNQPSTEPPQVLLLAITPELTGKWTWDDLEAILLDTISRAKKRAVEPQHLGFTPFAHILPAIMTSVTTYPFATISTDLVHQMEVAFTGLGVGTGDSG